MDWGLTEKFEKLKEMASKGLIPGSTLHQRMNEAREEEKLNTLKNMFAGNDLGESLLIDVLGANKGNVQHSIDILLEMTEQLRRQEEAQREEEARLAQFKREAESKREEERKKQEEQLLLEETLRREAENSFVGQQMAEFVHLPLTSDLVQLQDSPTSTSNDEATTVQAVEKGKEDTSPQPLEKSSSDLSPSAPSSAPPMNLMDVVVPVPETPPPPYHIAVQSIPQNMPKASAPPMEQMMFPMDGESLYSLNYGQFSNDNFFSTSWIPLSSYLPGNPKRVVGFDEMPNILSASVTGTAAKGLKNGLGENNCFLNVVIQSLWHLKAFRTKFIEYQDHSHTANIQENSCPFCALKIIFTQYQFGEESELPPTILRNAMSILHKAESRFQIGAISDAAELHDSLLSLLHMCVTGGDEKQDSFIHRVFSMHVIEYTKCECGKPQKPFPCKQFIFYVSAKGLSQQASQHMEVTNEGKLQYTISLAQAIRKVNQDDPRKCANEKCDKKNPLHYALANLPEVLTIEIVWTSGNPTIDYIHEVMSLIDSTLKVQDMFDSVVQQGTYTLRGMIAYYGLHYNAYFRNPKNDEWLVFDDSRVSKIGSSWQDVISKCCNGRWQPFVLFYEYTST